MRDDIRKQRQGPGHSFPPGHRFGGWHEGDHSRGRMHHHTHGHGPHEFFGGEGGEHWMGRFGGRHRGWGGFGGPGGPSGRERMERGMLRYVILDLLQDGPKHGYEIIKQLEERTGGRYSPSPGTLYPTLQYLEDLGLVRSDQEDGRRVYQLTDAGRAERDEHSRHTEGFWSRFQGRVPSGAALSEINFLKDALHDLMRTVGGVLHGAVLASDADTIRRVRQTLERAQNEVREIIAQGASVQSPGGDREVPSEVDKPEAPNAGQGQGTVRL